MNSRGSPAPDVSPGVGSASSAEPSNSKKDVATITFQPYKNESQLKDIMTLIENDLSEPYSVYTYRYFLCQWPEHCVLAVDNDGARTVGVIVCKLDRHKARCARPFQSSTRAVEFVRLGVSFPPSTSISPPPLPRPAAFVPPPTETRRGYIAMLSVHKEYRKLGIGSSLVKMAIQKLQEAGADEVVLETEVTNEGALRLYQGLGFVRDKRLARYYLNGIDAFRLKLWLR